MHYGFPPAECCLTYGPTPKHEKPDLFAPTGVSDDERVAKTMDKLSVNFGVEILTLVKGYVSTEVDARLSFDTEATLERAHNIIDLYQAAGETRGRQ